VRVLVARSHPKIPENNRHVSQCMIIRGTDAEDFSTWISVYSNHSKLKDTNYEDIAHRGYYAIQISTLKRLEPSGRTAIKSSCLGLTCVRK
jgi:hypothetical protein